MAVSDNDRKIAALTEENWPEFERLFGSRGACGGCWCMTPRLSRAEYEHNKGARNKQAIKNLVERGAVPGVLAFRGSSAVGWCSLGPRSDFLWLARSRILAPIDELPVWSIVCFFIAKEVRRSGVSVRLIEGACEFAVSRGAERIEAYPVEPRKNPMPPLFAYTGIASAFLRAGFRQVARRSETRPIMRREL